jgi:hypothetical protein
MLLASTHDSRREHTPELILTEVHARCKHCQRMWTISGPARRSPCTFFFGGAREEGSHDTRTTGEV